MIKCTLLGFSFPRIEHEGLWHEYGTGSETALLAAQCTRAVALPLAPHHAGKTRRRKCGRPQACSVGGGRGVGSRPPIAMPISARRSSVSDRAHRQRLRCPLLL